MKRREFVQALALAAPAMAGGRVRLRPAICAYSYRTQLEKKQLSYEDLVRIAVDNEVDGLDMTVYWFPSTEASFLMPLKRLAYRQGVEIYSISVRTNMCQPTAELRDKELAEVRKWVDVAATLGAGHIRVFGGTVPKTSTEDEASKWVVDVLSRGAEYAGTRGVILGLENHGGITARASRIVDIVKRVNSPWAAVNLDTGNFDEDAYEQIAQILPYTANVQFKTEIKVAKGKNEASDWDRLTKMLATGGYNGYMALEYEGKDGAMETMPPLLKKLGALARKYSAG